MSRGRAAFAWPSRAGAWPAARETFLERWLVSDVAAGRLLPWIPVAFGFGVVLYFTAEREPALWAAADSPVGAIAAFHRARARRSHFRCCSR